MATATPSRLSAPSATSPPSALSTAAEDGDGLVQSLTPLLEAPTLCWELHAAHCPLWTRVEELANSATTRKKSVLETKVTRKKSVTS